jgi:cycloeucalenol cycloisomerase
MIYNDPTIDLTLDAALVGSGRQRVPVIMYLYTQAYFMTYHTSAVVVLRRIRTSRFRGGWFLWAVTVCVIAYAWAWTETRAMANPWIEEQFRYQDLARMLRYGSIFYACDFIVSFPMFHRLEEPPDDHWTLGRICTSALAAGMLVFLLLDFWAGIIGTL